MRVNYVYCESVNFKVNMKVSINQNWSKHETLFNIISINEPPSSKTSLIIRALECYELLNSTSTKSKLGLVRVRSNRVYTVFQLEIHSRMEKRTPVGRFWRIYRSSHPKLTFITTRWCRYRQTEQQLPACLCLSDSKPSNGQSLNRNPMELEVAKSICYNRLCWQGCYSLSANARRDERTRSASTAHAT